MSTTLTLRVNSTTNDVAYDSMPSGADYYEDVATDDILYLTAGSAALTGGADIPTEDEVKQAATLIDDTDPTVVAHYILGDISEDELFEISNAGQKNKQYVFCCSFDGATASEPVLQAWDDDDMDTYTSTCLGGGSPASSWFHAVCTTLAAPGAAWTGTRLAGSSATYSVLLNNSSGALSVADDLYFNFYCEVPAGLASAQMETPILAIVYTTN